MKIAIDTSPLDSGHKVRGVGFYLEHLKNSLEKYFPNNEYFYFKRGDKISSVDVVHFPYFEPFFLAFSLYSRYKTVVTVHDLTPIKFKKHFPRGIKGEIIWQMQKFALRKANRIITDSKSSKKDIEDIVGIKANKIDVVYLAAGEEFRVISDKEKLEKVRMKYDLPKKFLLYVGDLTWNKNLPLLIDAVKKADLPLVMVGKAIAAEDFDRTNPWNRDQVKVEQLTQDDKRFIKVGFVPTEDLVAIYNLATVFIMPSLYEGFGLPVLEAMASGTPVITTKEGSLEEVASDAAFYVDPYEMESIYEGINKVFSSDSLRESLSKKGLENVKRFSWKNTAKETLDTYNKL